jgi:hypothetical protein
MVGKKKARPHPGPLPQQGETLPASGQILALSVKGFNAHIVWSIPDPSLCREGKNS